MKKILIILICLITFTTIPVVNALEVEYKGTKNMVSDGRDIFEEQTGKLYPGDKFEGQVVLKNTSELDREFFLKIDATPATDVEAVEQLMLTITLEKDGETTELFEDNFSLGVLNEYITIGQYLSGSEGILHVTVTLPEELDNEFSNKNIETIWTFYVDEENGDIVPFTDIRVFGPNQNNNANLYMIIFFGASIFFAATLMINMRRQKKA